MGRACPAEGITSVGLIDEACEGCEATPDGGAAKGDGLGPAGCDAIPEAGLRGAEGILVGGIGLG